MLDNQPQQWVTPSKVASHNSWTSRNNLHVLFHPWYKTMQIIKIKTTLIFSPASNMTKSLEGKAANGCQTTTEHESTRSCFHDPMENLFWHIIYWNFPDTDVKGGSMVLSKLGKTMSYDVDRKFESCWIFKKLKPVCICWVIWGLLGGSFYSHPVFLSDSHSLTVTSDSI